MLGTAAYVLLLMTPASVGSGTQPAGADDNKLEASIGGNNETHFVFTSDWHDNGLKKGVVITETCANLRTDTSVTYVHPDGETGVLPKAEMKGGTIVPRCVTVIRTTHRFVEQAMGGVQGKASENFQMTAVRWREAVPGPWADPEREPLEAKLIEGDEKGKVLVCCTSKVATDKDEGFAFTYTIENRSEKPVRFKWAGWEGKIEPGKSFTKAELSKEKTRESASLAEFDFGESRKFAIRANLWARP